MRATACALIIFAAALGRAQAAPTASAPTASAPTAPTGAAWLDALGSADRRDVARAVTAISGAASPDPDLLFAAARACEDKLDDPARAAAIYARVVRAFPDARVATSAARRLVELRPLLGPHGETAAQAAELSQLIARADELSASDVLARGSLLTAAAWPGAPDAAVWLADWLRRANRLVEAHARYALVIARWPASPQARDAQRGAVATALDAQDWPLAARLADQLPAIAASDVAVRDDLRASAARGRRRARWYTAAWLVIAATFATLLASLARVAQRSARGTRWSTLRPPIEILFLAPVAAVLIGVAFTAHRLIAPAVATISIGGLLVAYLSGATLERHRHLGDAARLRTLLHLLLCLVSVVALCAIALTRDNLLDLLIETVRFGPES